MASISGLSKLGLPKLSEKMDPEDARALRNYLYQMQEQLQYVLSTLEVLLDSLGVCKVVSRYSIRLEADGRVAGLL